MKNKIIMFSGGFIALVLLVVAFSFGHQEASANPAVFTPKAATAASSTLPSAASSTISYMSAGTATTTFYYDAYGQYGSNQNYQFNTDTFAANTATLKIQFTASSTASVLRTDLEFADCPAGVNAKINPTACDWYQDQISGLPLATTSPISQLANPFFDNWVFASSSQGMIGVSSTNNRGLKAVIIPVPTRYVRVIFSVPAGAGAGAVYAEIIPKKEAPIK